MNTIHHHFAVYSLFSDFSVLVSKPLVPVVFLIMSSSTSTNSSNSQPAKDPNLFSSKPLASTLSQLCSVKLDINNFILWESSVLPIIKGHRLKGFILGSKKCLQQFIIEGTEVKQNPAFEEWSATNQILLGRIYEH